MTIDDAGAVRLSLAESRVNLLTRKASTRVSTSALPPLPDGLRPAFVLLTDKADQVYVAAEDGTILRYDTRDFDDPVLAERIDVLPGDLRLTAFRFLIGEQQIVVGASDGSADVYFRIQNHNAASTDGYSLVLGHPLERQPAPIVKVAPSKRSKMFATADADGNIWVRHATSEQTLLRLDSGEGAAGLVMSPRDNGLYAVDSAGRRTSGPSRSPTLRPRSAPCSARCGTRAIPRQATRGSRRPEPTVSKRSSRWSP